MEKQVLIKYLSEKTGEQLSWATQPRQGLFFTTQDFFLLPFAMFGCGFGYFFTLMPQMLKTPDYISYFGMLIILLSLYFSIFRFLVDSYLRAKTFYALSEHNAYIVIGSSIKKLELKKYEKASCDIATDGSGTIWFLKQTTLQMFLGNALNGWPFIQHPQAFLYINDVNKVFKDYILKSKK
jgi:hypothetical protein